VTSAFQWMAGWLATILVLFVISATAWGRPIVYYTLWLMVILLLVVSAPQINALFEATGFQTAPTQPTSTP